MKVYILLISKCSPDDFFGDDEFNVGDAFLSFEAAKEFVRQYVEGKNPDYKVNADTDNYYSVTFDIFDDADDMYASERVLIEIVERELIK